MDRTHRRILAKFRSGSLPLSTETGRHAKPKVPLLERKKQLRKAFSKFYRRHFELIEKYHVSLKKLLQQGISNPEFYGDLVYKFKKIMVNPNFSDLFKRIVNRFKRAVYTLNIMRQTACLVFNPIMLKAMLHFLVARRWFRPQTQ